MASFDAEFDVGEEVQHIYTREKFIVRFVVFGSTGNAVYQCFPKYKVGRVDELYSFDEPELELVDEDN